VNAKVGKETGVPAMFRKNRAPASIFPYLPFFLRAVRCNRNTKPDSDVPHLPLARQITFHSIDLPL